MGVEIFLPDGLSPILVPSKTESELKGSHFLTERHFARAQSPVPDHTEKRKEKGEEGKRKAGMRRGGGQGLPGLHICSGLCPSYCPLLSRLTQHSLELFLITRDSVLAECPYKPHSSCLGLRRAEIVGVCPQTQGR